MVPTTNYLINSKINLNFIISISIILIWLVLSKEYSKIKLPVLLIISLYSLELIVNIIYIQSLDYFYLRYLSQLIISVILALFIISRGEEILIKFSIILCITSILISISVVIGMLFQISNYEKIYNFNQNLTSGILLISLPMVNLITIQIRNLDVIKFFYKATILLVIGLILKSRFSFLLGIFYILLEILIENKLSRKNKIILIGGSFIFLIIIIYNNQRFMGLLNGNDILFRYLSWERLFTAGLNNFWFGSGYGSTSRVYNEYQNINSSIEIISNGKTFINSHSDFIEKFIGGGFIAAGIYLCLNSWIFYKLYRNGGGNKNLRFLGFAYGLIFLQSQIDVHNSHLGNLVLFTTLQFLLVNSFSCGGVIELRTYLTKFFCGIAIIIPIYFLITASSLKNHIQAYGEIGSLYKTHDVTEKCQKLKNQAPHFIHLDSYCLHNYLINNTGQNFNKETFEILLLESQKYNKFYISQLHVSAQFNAISRNDEMLKLVYRDLVYAILVNHRVIKINYDVEKLFFKVTNDPVNFKIDIYDQYIQIEVSQDLFNDIKIINSNLNAYNLPTKAIDSIAEEARSNSINNLELQKIAKNFLETVNLFGRRI